MSDIEGTRRPIREKPEVRACRSSVNVKHGTPEEPAAAEGAEPTEAG